MRCCNLLITGDGVATIQYCFQEQAYCDRRSVAQRGGAEPARPPPLKSAPGLRPPLSDRIFNFSVFKFSLGGGLREGEYFCGDYFMDLIRRVELCRLSVHAS